MTHRADPSAAVSLLPPDQLAPTVTFVSCWHYEQNLRHVYRIPSHHLVLVESGHIDAVTAHGNFDAPPGTLLCFRPAERNEYGNTGRTLFFQAHVRFAHPPRHRDTPYFPGVGALPLRLDLGEAFDEMRSLFETLCLSHPQGDAANRLRVPATIFSMLALIARVMKPSREETARLDPWERARLRLGSAGGFGLKIHDLAHEMGVSMQHFNRVFRRRFGCGAKEYQTRARLNEAVRRLCATDTSIKAIAYDLGFADARSMTRSIQQELGVSPSELREAPSAPLAASDDPEKRLYPINRHLVAPGTPDDWDQEFRVRT